MSEILGILETLEVMVSDAKKVPFSKKVMVDQAMILDLVDKMKFVAKRQEVELLAHQDPQAVGNLSQHETFNPAKDSAVQMVVDAKKEANEIRQEASRYADNVLSRLQLLVTKMQKNMVRLEENIKHGRLSMDDTLSPNSEEHKHDQTTFRQQILQSETTPTA